MPRLQKKAEPPSPHVSEQGEIPSLSLSKGADFSLSISPLPAFSYGLVCLGMAYISSMMGSVLQVGAVYVLLSLGSVPCAALTLQCSSCRLQSASSAWWVARCSASSASGCSSHVPIPW